MKPNVLEETPAGQKPAWRSSTLTVVRPPTASRDLITRVLDAGAAGVLVPAVDSVEQVQQVVRATKYRSIGKRGVHLFKASAAAVASDFRQTIEGRA